ncbi:hypothetical protein [Snodgrassella alvi]|jgi:hypothetical protein|uniref:hypothetical protein n=1 Tax=Snodgrassella alvi TaxID=1196083 RepID=UPI000C1EA5E4|nr:hypothetical protein [Snodgrassella alvi]PIT48561.1 hypothetical protein BHC51_04780 [Snodgrassella alvi]
MITVTKKEEPEIKYPVGRKWKSDGQVVIFWDEHKGTSIRGSVQYPPDGQTSNRFVSCKDYDRWTPVDLEISGEYIVFDGSKSTKEEIIYPIARRRIDDGLLVIFTSCKVGVVADIGRMKETHLFGGYPADQFWDEAMKPTDSNWEPANLKIYG